MPTHSRFTSFVAICGLLSICVSGYTLQDDYSGGNFFDMFNFFTDDDPTHGYVDFQAQSAAQSAGLINTNGGQIYMGVDSTNVATGQGRKSVRLTSKATYNHALIVLDLEHMPGSTCGLWPAFWTVGPDWPNNGEIDIIEGVNTQSHNAMTLHTGPGCSIASNTSPNGGSSDAGALFSGSVGTSNCDVAAQGQATNAGCSIATSETSSYGDGLNAVQGGVYATEWTSDAIRMWFFPRGSTPSDLDSSPDPSGWGTPLAAFRGSSCDIDSTVKDQQIVFDTTFCGDWAGQVWSSDPVCSKKAATCNDFVQNNPEAFTDAYWTINSLKVFTGAASGNATAPSASRPVSSVVPTASRPPVGTATGVPSNVPTARPTGASTSAPGVVPPMFSSQVGSKPNPPTTTLATSTNSVAQTVSNQSPSWGVHTRTWSWDNKGSARGTWAKGRSVAEATAAPVSLPQPMVIADNIPEDIDVQMVRRHMAKHKRHGGRF